MNTMKRFAYVVFLLVFMTLLVSCTKGEDDNTKKTKTIDIYYLNRDEVTIRPVSYSIQSEDTQSALMEVISIMQTNPEELELKAAILGDVSVLSCYVEDDKAILDFDGNYRNMSASTEILVRAALVRTLTQIEGINYVSILINEEPLLDAAGNVVVTMTPDMFIENAGSEINNYEKIKLQLYFANKDGTSLIPVSRTVVYNTNISMEKLVMEQLINGPTNEETSPTINPNTKIINVTVKDGTCYVNLDDSFLTQVYNVNSEVTIYSISNSLIALNNINKVQILINGESNVTYRESMNLNTAFGRNLDLIEYPE